MDVSALCQVASWSGAVLLWYCTSHKVDGIMKTNDYIQIFQLHPNQQLKLNWGEVSGPWSPTQFKTSFGKKQANITLLKWPWPQSYQILVRLLCTDIIACSLSQMTRVWSRVRLFQLCDPHIQNIRWHNFFFTYWMLYLPFLAVFSVVAIRIFRFSHFPLQKNLLVPE